jgi:hypothetical protein
MQRISTYRPKNMSGIMKLTLENTKVCPAVFEIVEQLKNLKIV